MRTALLYSLRALAFGCVCAVVMFGPVHSSIDEAEGPAAIAARPYVILLRHAQAPGRGEPENFDLSDCSTQRGLSDTGRSEARELGQRMKELGIRATKVLASRWCRTRETAQLLDIGPVEDSAQFDNLDFNRHRSQNLLENERRLVDSWRGPDVLVVVTHSSNLKALAGQLTEPDNAIVIQPGDDADWQAFSQTSLRRQMVSALR